MFELISRVPSRYYLAYGSNLDMERMGKRCPYAVVVGTTEIKGYRLLFKKSKTGCYATIEQDANESVPAVVWKLSEYDELLLDRYEGCPRYYYKKQFQLPVWNLNGNRMKKAKPCIAYVMHEDRRLGCPDAEYMPDGRRQRSSSPSTAPLSRPRPATGSRCRRCPSHRPI